MNVPYATASAAQQVVAARKTLKHLVQHGAKPGAPVYDNAARTVDACLTALRSALTADQKELPDLASLLHTIHMGSLAIASQTAKDAADTAAVIVEGLSAGLA